MRKYTAQINFDTYTIEAKNYQDAMVQAHKIAQTYFDKGMFVQSITAKPMKKKVEYREEIIDMTNKDMEIKKRAELVKALEAFKDAARELSAAWDWDCEEDTILTSRYPFDMDFMELTEAVSTWVYDSVEELKKLD
jgi:hypothetical protein